MVVNSLATSALELARVYAWFSALSNGDMRLMREFCEAGVPVDVPHPLRHTTALMEAARLGNAPLISFLLEQGANPILCSGLPKTSPLHMAIRLRHWQIAGMLTGAAERIQVLDAHGRTALHQLCTDILDPLNETLGLQLADMLMDRHCPINALDYEGITALHYCIINELGAMARLLLSRGADPNCAMPDTLVTPLLIAANDGRQSLAALLMEYGADPYTVSREGHNPLQAMPKLNRLQQLSSFGEKR